MEGSRKKGRKGFYRSHFPFLSYKSFYCCHRITDKIAFLKLYFYNCLPQIATDTEYTVYIFASSGTLLNSYCNMSWKLDPGLAR